jgi:O-acetyl-ADP-ribose deacetylase (regulator of RNase III)
MHNTFILNQCMIELTEGDITAISCDAIVNAANAQLILGGGVAGAIRQKGGPVIQEECNRIGGTFVGGAVITTAGNLPAKYVIHAVGPRMGEGDEDKKLKNATLNTLKIATEYKLNSIAFPAISTGIFGYPPERCARIMLQTAKDYLEVYQEPQKIIFCLWGKDNFEIFRQTMEEIV